MRKASSVLSSSERASSFPMPSMNHLRSAPSTKNAKMLMDGNITRRPTLSSGKAMNSAITPGGAGVGHAALVNGVNMGTATYNDTHLRAEFLQAIGGPWDIE